MYSIDCVVCDADCQPLPWILRMKVALGAAKGFSFLHSTRLHLVFPGFRSSKILLDSVRVGHIPHKHTYFSLTGSWESYHETLFNITRE